MSQNQFKPISNYSSHRRNEIFKIIGFMQQEAICSYIIENLCGINEEDYKDTPKDLEALKKWRDILQS